MNLAARRTVKSFQETKLPALQEALNKAAGFDVPLSIDWESLAVEGQEHLYEESWPAVYFVPLTQALQEDIAIDDMGVEALREKLKQVVFTNKASNYYPDSAITWADGTLTIDHEPTTNVADVDARKAFIASLLLKNL